MSKGLVYLETVLTVAMPCCKDAQFFLRRVSTARANLAQSPYHSGASQDRIMDPARIASETSREN
jgi:hypothetical protein